MLKLALIFAILLNPLANADSLFDRLHSHFEKARLPEAKELKGYWSGRCVEAAEKDKLLPAVFVYKVVTDETAFPPSRPTFTYFRDELGQADAYDKLTAQQVEKDPMISAWLKKEQWRPVEEVDGSWVTMFHMAGGVKIERAVRYYEDEFNSLILLRAARQSGDTSSTSRYCFFSKNLGVTTPDPDEEEEPVVEPAEGYLIGETLPTESGAITLINAKPASIFRSIRIENFGSRIRLEKFQIQLTDGKVTAPINLTLEAGEKVEISVSGYAQFSTKGVTLLQSPGTRVRVFGSFRDKSEHRTEIVN